MSRILLLIDHRQNRHLLAECLAQHHQVIDAEADEALQEPFDLAILDGPALDRLWPQLRDRKQSEEPIFLPVLLLTSHQGVDLVTRHLWQEVDEVVLRPVEKVELQARVEILLRARGLSVALQRQHNDLQAFQHAMAHELRAPLRAIAGFAQEVESASQLTNRDRRFLARVRAAVAQAQGLISSLLAFGRLGHSAVKLRRVSLPSLVKGCLQQLQPEIQARRAQITLDVDEVWLQADAALLKLALNNVLLNALTFAAPGVPPCIRLHGRQAGPICRLEVRDRGIGIAPEDQARLFVPFVRLHGMEEYPGTGLGLATVRKAVELMGGRVGLTSTPGAGSTFWIELSPVTGVDGDDEGFTDR